MADFEQEHIGSVAMGDIGAIEEAKSIAADINSLLPGEMRQMTFWHNAALKMAAALSRPAQEPVAWRHRLVGADEWNLGQEGSMQHARSYQKLFPDKIEIEPLYAAPQPAHGTSATERATPAPADHLEASGSDHMPRYTTKRLHDEIAKARAYGLEMAAQLIVANIVQDTSSGKVLSPRQEGNRDGLHYAAAIRSLASSEGPL